MRRIERKATLVGTIEGPIWQPGMTCQQDLTLDLPRDGRDRLLWIKAAVASAPDFQSRQAKLTADSFIIIEHREVGPPVGNGTVRSWTRRIDVTDLLSLADYVDADAFAYAD